MAVVGKADGSVVIKSLFDTSGVERGIQRIKGGFSGLGQSVSKLGALIAGAFAVKQIVSFAKACIDLGSDLEEVQNVVDVTFGGMSDQINQFAKEAAVNLGLSELAAKQYTSTLGAMYKSMGFSAESAAGMSMEMTKLAADMASFYNLEPDQAFQKIRAGISGETEPLKQLGVNLSEANLEQFRMNQGLTTAYSKMTQQEKALLRYNYLLSVTTDAQGDFARTSGSWANQVKVLKLQLDSIKADLGQGFIAILTPVLQVINKLLQGIAKLASAFKAFAFLITGKKAETNNAKGSSGIAEVADSTEDYTQATKDATKATKAARKENDKYLSGLDEIHTYTEKTADASTGKAGTSGGAGATPAVANVDFGSLETGETVVDKLAEKMKSLYDTIVKGTQPAIQALKNLWDNGLKKLKDFSWGALQGFYNNFLLPVGKWTLGTGFPKLVNLINDGLVNTDFNPLLTSLNGLWTALSKFTIASGVGLIQFFEDFLIPISQWTIGTGLPKFVEITSNGLAKIDYSKILKSLDGVWKALEPFAENVGGGLLWFYDNVLVKFGTWVANNVVPLFLDALAAAISLVNTIIQAAKPYFLWIWDNFLQPAASFTGGLIVGWLESLVKVLTTFGDWCRDHTEIVGAITTAVIAFFAAWKITQLVGGIATLISSMNPITIIIAAVIAAGVALIANWDTIKETAITVFTVVKEWVVSAWDNIKTKTLWTWEIIKAWLAAKWKSIKTAVVETWDIIKKKISSAWTFIKTKTTTTWNSIKSGLITAWNTVKQTAIEVWENVKNTIVGAWTTLKQNATQAWEFITSTIKIAWFRIKTAVTTKIKEIKEGIAKKWEEITQGVTETWDAFKKTITDTWEAIRDSELYQAVSDAISGTWDTIKSTAEKIWSGIGGIKETVTGVWEEFRDSKLYQTVAATISGTWGTIKDTASKMWSGENGNGGIKGVITGAWNALLTAAQSPDGVWNLLSGTISDTWDTIKETANKMWSGEDGNGGIKGVITGAWDALVNAAQKPDGFSNLLSSIFSSTWGTIKDTASRMWSGENGDGGIKGAITGAWDAILTAAQSPDSVWNTITGVVGDAWDTISKGASNLWSGEGGIVDTVKGAWEALETAATGINNPFEGIKNAVVGTFEDIASLLAYPINGVIGLINWMVGGVVDGINAVIDTLNNFNIQIPNWKILGDLAGGTFGFSISRVTWSPIPEIPLAKGAVIPPHAPFLATLGDQRNGMNLEAPEGLLRQIMREENGGDINVTINLDGKVVYENVLRRARRQQQYTGVSPFELA